jgi:nicotinamide-nucleotide amidase
MNNAIVKKSKLLLDACKERNIMIATAESCTGGMIASSLIDIAGSSSVFDRGFVTYSDDAKTDMLGVHNNLFKQVGAVSEEVARAMAEGALKNSDASLAVSSTGIAGPDGGTAEKPVGLVYVGVASAWDDAQVLCITVEGDRGQVRQTATLFALDAMLQCVKKKLSS